MDGEWILTKMPRIIYVKFPGATWTILDDFGPGVYPVTPVSRTWVVNQKTQAKVRRTGYFLVADFASTAHWIQGQSLDACFPDVVDQDLTENPTEVLQISGYVMLSRARNLDRLWILQAFAQNLFAQGPPTGPHILMQKLKGDITTEQAEELMLKATIDKRVKEESNRKQKGDMDTLYCCAQCLLLGKKAYMKPRHAFGAYDANEILPKILKQGAWARCLECKEIASTRREKHAGEKGSKDLAPSGVVCEMGEGLQCTVCKEMRPYGYYDESALKNQKRNLTRTCNVCKKLKLCSECQRWQAATYFRERQVIGFSFGPEARSLNRFP